MRRKPETGISAVQLRTPQRGSCSGAAKQALPTPVSARPGEREQPSVSTLRHPDPRNWRGPPGEGTGPTEGTGPASPLYCCRPGPLARRSPAAPPLRPERRFPLGFPRRGLRQAGYKPVLCCGFRSAVQRSRHKLKRPSGTAGSRCGERAPTDGGAGVSRSGGLATNHSSINGTSTGHRLAERPTPP